MENMTDFNERLKELMFDAKNIKSDELAKAVGVSMQTVYAWRDGTQMIALNHFIKLANFFQCSTDYLAGLSKDDKIIAPKECADFYARLRKVMHEKGISRYKMTKNSKIKDSYFTNWKKGANPFIHTVILCAEYLDVTLDYLLGRE